ncbi:prepilin-type N-terminal cleavage/methylation domain-containing protein [Haloferula sp.]|uniref:prepilin-type N-terminal cleavage/methylation domain-containing protein n=1 Tax=Haloferula sp. TaxID=2497595 RepID=UPI003C70ADEF
MKHFEGIGRRPQGFTLMELLVVVSIMVILAGLTMGLMSYVNQKQASETAKVQLGLLELAIEEYKADNGVYPGGRRSYSSRPTDRAIMELQEALFPSQERVNGKPTKIYLTELDPDNDTQGWLSGTNRKSIEIVDPWGTFYNYRTNDPDSSNTITANPGFDLWSSGPDGQTNAGSRGDYDPEDSKNIDDVRLW